MEVEEEKGRLVGGEAESWKVQTPGAGWYTLQYLKYFPNLFALKYLLYSISNLPLK